MSASIFDIPIMPLPNVVFFPRTLLPLLIFEPRYRKMTEDLLVGDRRLGVPLMKTNENGPILEPSGENAGKDPIYKVLGVGTVVDYERLPDGKFRLKLEGQARARIREELPSEPYRLARVEVVSDSFDVAHREELNEGHQRLMAECRRLAQLLPEHAEFIDRILVNARHPSILADQAAHNFVPDMYERQCILSETDVIRRVSLTSIQIGNLNLRMIRNRRSAT